MGYHHLSHNPLRPNPCIELHATGRLGAFGFGLRVQAFGTRGVQLSIPSTLVAKRRNLEDVIEGSENPCPGSLHPADEDASPQASQRINETRLS